MAQTGTGRAVPVAQSRPLLLAKLSVPSTPARTVDRPRLNDRLSQVGDARLTTVVAPGGWGKSTMLASWAVRPGRRERTAWLPLDAADDEPIRFWTYALSTLATVAPDLTRDSLAVLQAPGLDPVGLALSLLLNALSDSQVQHVLVLDDYHLLADPVIHQSVEFLLSYLPQALRLVVAS